MDTIIPNPSIEDTIWRSKAKLTSHSHIPLSHILKGLRRQGERYLKENYHLQLYMNHIYIKTPISRGLFEQILRSISKYIRIHNWKNLRKIQLQISTTVSITDNDLKLLSLMISQVFPKAQEISLTLPKFSEYMRAKNGVNGVPELVSAICRNAPNLKAFSLYLPYMLNEETITVLGHNIGEYASRLEVLKLGLVLKYCHSLRYGNFQVFDLSTRIKIRTVAGSGPYGTPKIKEGTKMLTMEVASKLNKLKSLTYIITHSDGGVSDETVNHIMSNTGKRLPNLEQLSLVFSAFEKDQYTNIGIKSIFTNISQYLKNLRSLSLDFSESKKFNDEVMQSFAVCMVCMDSSLRGLNSLSLNFYGCKQLTSGGVNLVCWAIAEYLENLENLVIGFEGCKGFTPEAVQKLTSNHHIKHLKWLTFAFNGDTFGDLETGQATIQLVSSFKTLRKFELNIPTSIHLERMTDASLIAIGTGVSTYLKDLEVLSLIFPMCQNLTSIGIHQFTSDIALNHKKLKSLDLTFGGNIELSDNTLVNLSDNISNNMVELEELTLHFRDASSTGSLFTDKGIKHLAFSLCNGLNRLRSLSINLPGPSSVVAQGIVYLGSIIKNYAKQLKFLYLEFLLPRDPLPQDLLLQDPLPLDPLTRVNRMSLLYLEHFLREDPQIQQAKSSLLKDLWFIPTVHIISYKSY